MFSRVMGSPSSLSRIALLRALYRKQYLTPTIILDNSELEWTRDTRARSIPGCAHHKFVKTTPKPNATKNKSGDEFPLPEVLPEEPSDVPVGDADEDVDDMTVLKDGVPETEDADGAFVDDAVESVLALVVKACLTTIRAPSTMAWLRWAIFVSTDEDVAFAKNSNGGYHDLAKGITARTAMVDRLATGRTL